MLKMNEVAYLQSVTSGIGDHNTVSNGPDTGANNNLACAFWQSMRHATTQDAVNNFKSRLGIPLSEPFGISGLNIAGHGNEGFFTTGSGQNGVSDYRTNFMANWNEFIWGPIFDQLKNSNVTILTIWSCHTGAGVEGADFLFALAKRINKPVRGCTGFLFSNDRCQVWLENGAVWQVATPQSRPNPISAPSPHFSPETSRTGVMEVDAFNINNSDIISMTILFKGHEISRLSRSITESDIISSISDEITNSTKFELPGKPAAFMTAELRVSYKNQSGGESEYVLQFMNDRMVVISGKDIGFYVGPVLLGILKTLRGDR